MLCPLLDLFDFLAWPTKVERGGKDEGLPVAKFNYLLREWLLWRNVSFQIERDIKFKKVMLWSVKGWDGMSFCSLKNVGQQLTVYYCLSLPIVPFSRSSPTCHHMHSDNKNQQLFLLETVSSITLDLKKQQQASSWHQCDRNEESSGTL